MPLVSILLPFRDAAKTIQESLQSVCQQSFTDFEIIAVNDNSLDQSKTIISEFPDERIKLFDSPGDGLVDALNFGLEQVSCDWIARMDADDIMHADKLKKQWTWHLSHPDVDVIATQAQLFPEEMVTDGFRRYMDWQNRVLSHEDFINQQYVEMPLTNPTALFRREMVAMLGTYELGSVPEDYEYWLRALHYGYRFVKLPEILFDWRESPKRYTRTAEACTRDAFDRVRARYLSQDARIRSNRPLVVCGAGRVTRKRVRLLQEQGHIISAWIDVDPAKIGSSIEGCPVHAPEWLYQRHAVKPYVLIYIASHGARESFGEWLEAHHYHLGIDYLAVG